MAIIKIRERGQITIPAGYRKDLGLEENEALNLTKIGDALVLTHKRLAGDAVSKKMEMSMKKKSLSLNDLLEDLKVQRSRYVKEVYGRKSKT